MTSEGSLWEGRTLHDLYKEAYTPWEWHEGLMKEAHSLGMECFSSPFDFTAVDYLENLNVPAYKIASFEINDIPLIRKIAALHKPIIFATGIAYEEDIELALATCKEQGNENVILLKCVSAYPTPYDMVNLRMMQNLKDKEILSLSTFVAATVKCFSCASAVLPVVRSPSTLTVYAGETVLPVNLPVVAL